MSSAAAEIEYLPREVFNVHLQSIAEKNELERKIDALDAKFTRKFDALDSKIDKVEAQLNDRLDKTKIELQGQINVLAERIDGVEAKLTAKIDGLDKSIESLDKNQNKWFAVFGLALTFITIAIPFITITAQKFFLN
ncbi:MAG: hypothetical protein IJ597_05130 [Synergistaceae bacterium]|nr:hypothetical protein [Synergistaceae bacterium]